MRHIQNWKIFKIGLSSQSGNWMHLETKTDTDTEWRSLKQHSQGYIRSVHIQSSV